MAEVQTLARGLRILELLAEYDKLNKAIKKAETDLYNYPNRHLETEKVKELEKAKDDAIAAFLLKMPKVFDPFAGGGAIPLEAARLGCNSYGNDIKRQLDVGANGRSDSEVDIALS